MTDSGVMTGPWLFRSLLVSVAVLASYYWRTRPSFLYRTGKNPRKILIGCLLPIQQINVGKA